MTFQSLISIDGGCWCLWGIELKNKINELLHKENEHFQLFLGNWLVNIACLMFDGGRLGIIGQIHWKYQSACVFFLQILWTFRLPVIKKEVLTCTTAVQCLRTLCSKTTAHSHLWKQFEKLQLNLRLKAGWSSGTVKLRDSGQDCQCGRGHGWQPLTAHLGVRS